MRRMSWRLQPEDFAALWFAQGWDRIPEPLHHQSQHKTIGPAQAHAEHVREQLEPAALTEIEAVSDIFQQAELRIEIIGSTTAARRCDLAEYRVAGARVGDHSAVLSQRFFDGVSDPIYGEAGSGDSLANLLVGKLPARDPGLLATQTFHIADITGPQGYWDRAGYSPQERFQHFLRRGVDGGASASCWMEPVGDRQVCWGQAQWLDLTDDGRYLQQRTDNHLEIRPATGPLLAKTFASWITPAMDIIDRENGVY